MKLEYFALACVIMLATAGCGTIPKRDLQVKNWQHSAMPIVPLTPERTETVAYRWPGYGIEVSFCRHARNPHWIMAVRDSDPIVQQVLLAGSEEKIWASSDSKCSIKECLAIIDRGLKDFHSEKPQARLESLQIEMHIINDLWNEVLVGVRERLLTLPGEKIGDAFEVPTEIGDAVVTVVRESTTATAIKRLMREHGLNLGVIGTSWYIFFKDSLSGRKWSDIATLPGLGILAPGTIEFNLDSRMGSLSDRSLP